MKPRIAIACSGLGNVRRGNETWASQVAQALHEAGTDVTLLGGGPDVDVTCPYVRVANMQRDSFLSRLGVSWHHRYLLEQLTFSMSLQRHLLAGKFDVLQVADPALALRLQQRKTQTSPRVVYKDGLLLGPPWCRKFDFVQVLAPYYREQAAKEGVEVGNWFVIPHLVDVRKFVPATNRAELRTRRFSGVVPSDAFVVMAAGDFSPGSNKRLDWVLQEFAALNDGAAHLIVVGQSAPEDFRRFEQAAKQSLGGRVHLFTNVNAARMMELYQAADVFAHAALREPFGIVFLEAMACGLPIVAHQYEVTRWIVGEAGQTVDMSAAGQLADVLRRWRADGGLRQEIGHRARQRAEMVFAPGKIVPLYQAMYEKILRG